MNVDITASSERIQRDSNAYLFHGNDCLEHFNTSPTSFHSPECILLTIRNNIIIYTYIYIYISVVFLSLVLWRATFLYYVF